MLVKVRWSRLILKRTSLYKSVWKLSWAMTKYDSHLIKSCITKVTYERLSVHKIPTIYITNGTKIIYNVKSTNYFLIFCFFFYFCILYVNYKINVIAYWTQKNLITAASIDKRLNLSQSLCTVGNHRSRNPSSLVRHTHVQHLKLKSIGWLAVQLKRDVTYKLKITCVNEQSCT